jgi:23S rRNA pseudouridine1911/1915/1917 synthase
MALLKTGGRAALTRYTVLRPLAGGSAALVECRLATGRTHQIRVHLSARGHPVIGDAAYGGKRKPPSTMSESQRAVVSAFPRQALHATRLALLHPADDRPMEFNAPPPEDFQTLMEALDKAQ